LLSVTEAASTPGKSNVDAGAGFKSRAVKLTKYFIKINIIFMFCRFVALRADNVAEVEA